jgi:hypothetical protein
LPIVLLLSACATVKDIARHTQATASRALGVVATRFVEYDQTEQVRVIERAVPGRAIEALETYRATVQRPMIKALKASIDALRLLDSALDAAENGGAKGMDFGKLASDVIRAVTALSGLVKTLGLPFEIPNLMGALK